jgi:hypothetical protein
MNPGLRSLKNWTPTSCTESRSLSSMVPVFLNDEEYSQALENEMHRYYQYLAKKYIEGGGATAISFHCEELAKEGIILSKKKLLKALFLEMLDLRALFRRFRGRHIPNAGKGRQFFWDLTF